MKALKIAIATVALTTAVAAAAENLVYYARDRLGSVLYYDSDTLRQVSGGFITVWIMEDASRNRTEKYRTRRVLMKIDCDGMRSGAVSFAYYDANGRVMDRADFDYPRMTPDVPGSTGYSLVEAVCAR